MASLQPFEVTKLFDFAVIDERGLRLRFCALHCYGNLKHRGMYTKMTTRRETSFWLGKNELRSCSTGQERLAFFRVRSGYGKSGKSMEVAFSISRPGKSMENNMLLVNVWKFLKSFGNFKKKVWNFLSFTWEKKFEEVCFPLERSEAAAASLTESNLSVVPSFHVSSYSSYKLRKAGPQLLARKASKRENRSWHRVRTDPPRSGLTACSWWCVSASRAKQFFEKDWKVSER